MGDFGSDAKIAASKIVRSLDDFQKKRLEACSTQYELPPKEILLR